MDETVALDLAVETAVSLLSEDDRLDESLIIVTADHAHTMTISGYPHRGNDIIGRKEAS